MGLRGMIMRWTVSLPQREKLGQGKRYIVAYGMTTPHFKTPWKEVRILVVVVLPR